MKNFAVFINISFVFYLHLSLGCVQKNITPLPVAQLFPDGTYTQSIQLVIFPNTKKTKQIPFTSLSKIDGEQFKILGLTPFGTKAFEAQGNLQSEDSIQIKFHMETPQFLNSNFVKRTLFQMHSFKKLKKSDLKSNHNSDWYKMDDLQLNVYSYTTDGIPKEFKVSSKKWVAFVATSRFQKKKTE